MGDEERRPLSALLAALLPTALLLGASTALADSEKAETFHVMEIVQVLAGYNGNTAIQAIEMRELAAGQDLAATGAVNVYDKDGVLATTLGTFAANVANGTSGAHILCATSAFAAAFSITPDLVLTAGIPLPSGQIVFEKAGCKVNSVPYGAINTIVANTSVAPTIPTLGATVLFRTADAPTTLTCPLSDNGAARFAIRSGTSASSFLVFQTNTGDTAHVWSTVTGVGTGSHVRAGRSLPASGGRVSWAMGRQGRAWTGDAVGGVLPEVFGSGRTRRQGGRLFALRPRHAPRSPHDDRPLLHVHAAGERDLAGLQGTERDAHRLIEREALRDVARRDHHLGRAGLIGLPRDEERHRLAVLHLDPARLEAVFGDRDRDLGLRPASAPGGRERQGREKHDRSSHGTILLSCRSRHHRRTPRSRVEFQITDTELKLIAAAAMIGLRRSPKNGYSTPAATGTPSTL